LPVSGGNASKSGEVAFLTVYPRFSQNMEQALKTIGYAKGQNNFYLDLSGKIWLFFALK
jgi:hypothetical protein